MLMGVTDGVRTAEQQFALYQQGRTQQNNAWVKTGDTVTNCDGVLKRSNHQPHESDGLGHAVDVAFIVDMNEDGQVALNEPFTWDQHRNWALYGAMAKAIGCVWGGDWVSIVDLPHIELP